MEEILKDMLKTAKYSITKSKQDYIKLYILSKFNKPVSKKLLLDLKEYIKRLESIKNKILILHNKDIEMIQKIIITNLLVEYMTLVIKNFSEIININMCNISNINTNIEEPDTTMEDIYEEGITEILKRITADEIKYEKKR